MVWRKSRKIKTMVKAGPSKEDRAMEQRKRRAQLKQELHKGAEQKRERVWERWDMWSYY